MQISRRLFTIVLALPPSSLLGAVRGDEVRYVGGMISSVPQGQDGSLLINPAVGLLLECKKGKFDIPFDQISSIEYGQKAGRRIGVAVVINPLFLLSKKRKHFVTMGYKDATGMR